MSRSYDAREERFGRYFDEFEVGDVYHHWPGKTITRGEENSFCLLTMAASPVHVDAHYAAREMLGGRNLVVGTYVYALLVGMSVPDTSGKAIAALGTDRLRHIAPLHHGDTLYGESTVVALRESASHPGAGIVTIETRGRNQDETVVCEFRRAFLAPTAKASRVEDVAARLRAEIVSDKFQPGSRVTETAVAEDLGASRGSVREALQMLEREGLVVRKPNRGTYVARQALASAATE